MELAYHAGYLTHIIFMLNTMAQASFYYKLTDWRYALEIKMPKKHVSVVTRPSPRTHNSRRTIQQ